jgi:hypothetical protein
MDDRDFETPWLNSQPSAVQLLIPQTERATSLAELEKPGQQVYVLIWTRS